MRQRQRRPYPYRFPFLESQWGRTDQGVDFTGKGPILALGRAKILRLGAPGWPEGGGVLYQLLEGPQRGKNIFVYEGVDVAKGLKVGQIVQKGQPIANFRPGGSIEIGFADSAGAPLSHAEYNEGDETIFGKAFGSFLHKVQKRDPLPPSSAYDAPSLGTELLNHTLHPGQSAQEAAGIAAGAGADAVVGGLSKLFAGHAEALALNIALVGGGAFLAYYGASLLLGVKAPVGTPLKAATGVATKGMA